MNPVVSAKNISVSVQGKLLLECASLELYCGQFTVIIGPNGAGKSTLLKAMTGEIVPASGFTTYGGAAISTIPPWRLACQRAVMVQKSQFTFPFKVFEVLRIGMDGLGRKLREDHLRAIIADALKAADLTNLSNRDYQTLSGGEQQRVQFARVCCQLAAGKTVCDRQVLFLDEPISSLDLYHQLEILDASRELAKQGVAILAILHDLNLAALYADHLILMSEGCIVTQGSPAQVLTKSQMREVFRLDMEIGISESSNLPFVLPQNRKNCRGWPR